MRDTMTQISTTNTKWITQFYVHFYFTLNLALFETSPLEEVAVRVPTTIGIDMR